MTIGMQTGMQTGLQTGVSSVYTGRPVCKPVCQPIVVTFTQGDWFAYRYAPVVLWKRNDKLGFKTLFTYLATPTCVITKAVFAACRWKRSIRSNIYI